jgi:hypothetical protein
VSIFPIYCPVCGEELPEGRDYCDDTCQQVAATPRPTMESLREIAAQLDRYEAMLNGINRCLASHREAIERRERLREGARKRRFRAASLEAAVKKHQGMCADGRDWETDGSRRLLEKDEESRLIIAEAEAEQARIRHAIQVLRVNHQVETFDYETYLLPGLPLPPDRQALYQEPAR